MALGAEGVLAEEAPALPAPAPLDHLVRRVRQGDLEAFGDLMAATEGRVLGLACRLLADRDLARDAAQEVYLRAYRSLAAFRDGESLPAWLAAITLNVCRDLGRRRRGHAPLDEEAHAVAPSAEATLLHAERRDLVRQALCRLTPAERTALVLRDLEGRTTEEAAALAGVRAGTLRTQVASARAKVQAFCARKVFGKGGQP